MTAPTETWFDAVDAALSAAAGGNAEAAAKATETLDRKVREINARLERCAAALDANDAPAAIAVAETAPALFSELALLELAPLEAWDAWRADRNLPAAPKLRFDLSERLRKTYASPEAARPLADIFRGERQSAPRGESVRRLRALVALCPDDPGWRETLTAFETEWIETTLQEARTAIETGAFAALKRARQALNSPDRRVKVRDDALAKIDRVLAERRGNELARQTEATLEKINAAYLALDLNALERALSRWDALEKGPEFAPTATQRRQVEEARDWARAKREKQHSEKAFQALIVELTAALDNEADEAALDRLHYQAKGFDAPLPEALEGRYNVAREMARRARDRKARSRIVLSLILAAAAALALVAAIRSYQRYRLIREWDTAIDVATRERGPDAAERLFATLREKHPDLYDLPSFVQSRDALVRLKQEKAARKARFEAALATVRTALKNAGPGHFPDKGLDAVLDEAARFADTPEEQRLADELRQEKEDRVLAVRKEIDRRFLAVIAEADRFFAIADALPPTPENLAPLRRAAADYEAKLLIARHFPDVGREARENNLPLREDRSRLLRDLIADLEKTIAERAKNLDAVYKDPCRAEAYALAMKRFVEKYPTDPLTPGFRKVLERLPAHAAAEGLSELDPKTASDTKIKAALETSLSRSPEQNPWKSDATAWLERAKRLEGAADRVRENLRALADNPVSSLSCLVFKTRDGGFREFYSTGPFEVREEKINGKAYRSIRGKVLRAPSDRDGQPRTFRENLDGSWTLDNAETLNAELVGGTAFNPWQEFYAAFLAALMETRPDAIAPFLAATLVRLKTLEGLNPFLRCQFAVKSLEALETLSRETPGPYRAEREALAAFLARYDETYNWMALSPEAYRRFSERLNAVPDYAPTLAAAEANDALLATALGRRLKGVGAVRTVGAATVVDLRVKGDFRELWAVLPDASGKNFVFAIVGTRDQPNAPWRLFPEFKDRLPDGSPLLAPSDNADTLRLTRDIKARQGALPLSWPASWPFNAR